MKQLLLIDTHALLHRFFHALPPLTTPQNEQIQAIYGLCGVLLKALNPEPGTERPDYIAAALDRPEPTFRKEQYHDYKIHRAPTANALIEQIKRMPEMFTAFGVRTLSAPGFEADDMIGSAVERFKDEPDLMITIVSGDLDLFQLVQNGRVSVELLKGGSAMERTDEAGVMKRLGITPAQVTDYKGLVGDASDNIPGVKGIGPKTARELLHEFGTIEKIYEDIGLIKRTVAEKLLAHRDDAFSSKMLATIRRDAPLELSSLEELRTPEVNRETLAAYFHTLGFESLAKKL